MIEACLERPPNFYDYLQYLRLGCLTLSDRIRQSNKRWEGRDYRIQPLLYLKGVPMSQKNSGTPTYNHMDNTQQRNLKAKLDEMKILHGRPCPWLS